MSKLCLVLLAAMIAAAPVGLTQESATEQELKAAFIFRFLNFVEWPEESFESADSPLHVGLLGESELEDALRVALKDKTVHGRAVRFSVSADQEGLNACQVLFVGETGNETLTAVLDQVNIGTVLTVSDLPDFAASGGMIQLFRSENKIRFHINMGSVKNAKIRISSRLLQLASSILDDSDPKEDKTSQT